jgi:hypothetical protein
MALLRYRTPSIWNVRDAAMFWAQNGFMAFRLGVEKLYRLVLFIQMLHISSLSFTVFRATSFANFAGHQI